MSFDRADLDAALADRRVVVFGGAVVCQLCGRRIIAVAAVGIAAARIWPSTTRSAQRRKRGILANTLLRRPLGRYAPGANGNA